MQQKNCHSEKVRYKLDCYILHAVLLITIIYYNYAKHMFKKNDIDALTIQKWKLRNVKKFILKDFIIDEILIDQN